MLVIPEPARMAKSPAVPSGTAVAAAPDAPANVSVISPQPRTTRAELVLEELQGDPSRYEHVGDNQVRHRSVLRPDKGRILHRAGMRTGGSPFSIGVSGHEREGSSARHSLGRVTRVGRLLAARAVAPLARALRAMDRLEPRDSYPSRRRRRSAAPRRGARHLRLVAKPLVEALQQAPPPARTMPLSMMSAASSAASSRAST